MVKKPTSFIVQETRTVIVDNDTLRTYVIGAIDEGWHINMSTPDGTRDKATRLVLIRDTPLPL
jgi:hypothetical protein